MRKVNYLNNRDLLSEIHKSKSTYSSFTDDSYAQFDIILPEVGKINMYDNWAYVAVHHEAAKIALKKISEGKMKGRSIRVRRLRG